MAQTKAYRDAAGLIHIASERNREGFQRATCGLRSRLLRPVDHLSLNDMCEECRDARASSLSQASAAQNLTVVRDAELRGRAHRESLIAKGIVRPSGERR